MYEYESVTHINTTCGSYARPECQDINLTTCIQMPRPTNQSLEVVQDSSLDSDGCFYMNPSRETAEYKTYEQFSLVIGLLTMAFGGLGLVGNSVSILVLTSKNMRSNCFNNILTALNITDSLHIIFAILDVLRVDFKSVYEDLLPQPFFPYFHYPGLRICLCASIYLIMAVGVERYLAVCRPHHYREVQARSNRAALYIGLAMLGALCVCIPRFLEVELISHCIDFSHCDIRSDCSSLIVEKYHRPTKLRLDRLYIIFYHFWLWILVTGIVPFVILTVLNFKIFTAMKKLKRRLTLKPRQSAEARKAGMHAVEGPSTPRKKSPSSAAQQQKKEFNLVTVLVSTALTFFLLHLPRILTSVYEAVNIDRELLCKERKKVYHPLWFLYCIIVMNSLLVLNASSNFLICLFAGNSFREQFLRMFGCESCTAQDSPTSRVNGVSRGFLPSKPTNNCGRTKMEGEVEGDNMEMTPIMKNTI